MDEAKLARFRALVRHAYQYSPYYRNLMDQQGIRQNSCVPGDFPVLTKSLLMANFDNIVTDKSICKQAVAEFLTRSTDPNERLFDKFIVMHTSGTSGEVGYFLYSPADYKRMMRGSFIGRRPEGNRPRKKRAKRLRRIRLAFYGATGGHFAGVTSVTQMLSGILRLFVKGRMFEVNSPLPEVLAELDAFQPDVLIGYTMALKILAEQQRSGNLHINPISISCTGETATSADMEYLADSFAGASVLSMYGSTEHMMMGYSKPDGDTMVLADRNLEFEFYPDHSVVTNLFNYTLPLIRYRMADILEPVVNEPGKPLIIRNLVGRSEQMPRFINRHGAQDFISPHTINEIFVAGVNRFQFQVTGDSEFTFVVILDPALSDAGQAEALAGVERRLREILAQKGLDNVQFSVQVVNDIPLNARTRKFQLIVNKRAA